MIKGRQVQGCCRGTGGSAILIYKINGKMRYLCFIFMILIAGQQPVLSCWVLGLARCVPPGMCARFLIGPFPRVLFTCALRDRSEIESLLFLLRSCSVTRAKRTSNACSRCQVGFVGEGQDYWYRFWEFI